MFAVSRNGHAMVVMLFAACFIDGGRDGGRGRRRRRTIIDL